MIAGSRYKNVSNVAKYFAFLGKGLRPEEYSEKLSSEERLTERVYLSLRYLGLKFEDFAAEFGVDLLAILCNEIEVLVASDFATFENKTLKLTPKGYYICDEITLRLLKKLEKANVQNIR